MQERIVASVSESPSMTIQREARSSYWHQRIARHAMIALADIGCVAHF
jgi:hypothetical protein